MLYKKEIPHRQDLWGISVFAQSTGLEPATSHVTGGCSNQLSYDCIYIYLSESFRWCRRQGSNLWPEAYESSALPTELRRHILSLYQYKHKHTMTPCLPKQLRRRVRHGRHMLGMSRADLLRDPESNRGLKVMSLARYLFSIPLYVKLYTSLSRYI